jgi:predicted porin
VDAARELIKKSGALLPETRALAEEPRDFPENRPVDRPFRFYGSMRLRLLLRDGDAVALNTETSRIGFNANGRISKAVGVYGRIELATTLGDRNILSDSGSDPGGENITDKVTFGRRLLFIGLETPKGNVSVGKQWSAYYDIGVFTDQLPYLGARGTGVYNAGTDGGASGTGRANESLQYRGAIQPFKYTVQIQARNETSNDRGLIDTYGFSLSMRRSDVDFGIAFQKVLDGVAEPQEGEPKDGDQAAIIGVRYDKDAWYAALTLTSFRRHEIDDLGAFYSGIGAAFYADRDLGQRWNVSLDIGYLRPESRYAGEFLVRQFILGMNCDLTSWFRLWVMGKLDTGRRSDGTRGPAGTLILAGHFDF